MDVLTQVINEASDPTEFHEAAILVAQHIRSNRNEDANIALVAQLAYRGHALIARWQNGPYAYAAQISSAVMAVLSIEPSGRTM